MRQRSARLRAGTRRCAVRRAAAVLLAAAAVATLASAAAQPAPGDVYYEIFVRSFQDSDGDGVGDLAGVTERLPYLAELGIDGIWLMPIHPSPSYHGYDVTDYTAVNRDYGTLDDLRTLAAEAEALGIDVLLDLVVNHTSVRHPWFVAAAAGDAERRDWYLWSDTRLDWRGPSGGPTWHASPAGDGYYLGLFWSGMPDLNHTNPEVTEEMLRVAAFWIEQGVDGFRVDAIKHIVEADGATENTPETYAWVRDFDAAVRELGGFLVGETWTPTPSIVRYHETSDLDLSFNYPLFSAILASIQGRNAIDVAQALRQDARLYPADARRATFVSNHDQVRPATTLSLLRRDVPRLKLAASAYLTAPGVPFVYYGEEIGMPNGAGDGDPAKRTPMLWTAAPGHGFSAAVPWTGVSSDDPSIPVAAQAGDPDSLLEHYRRLIALRETHPALDTGSLEVLDAGTSALLVTIREARDGSGERLLVALNFGTRAQELDLAALVGVGGTDLLTGEALAGVVEIPRLGSRVVQLDRP